MLPLLLPALLAAPAAPTLAEWVGQGQDPAPFLAFSAARRHDLGAAAREPHRAWLQSLVDGQREPFRSWAAARLVEACAPQVKGGVSLNGLFLDACLERFNREVVRGNDNRERLTLGLVDPPEPWRGLGRIAELAPGAPAWDRWRGQLRSAAAPAVPMAFYALFSPNLQPGDGGWVKAAFLAAAGTKDLGMAEDLPWVACAFLLATDWLMAYGLPADWQAFREACPVKTWSKTLAALEKDARRLPLFWPEGETGSLLAEGAKGNLPPAARPWQEPRPAGTYVPAKMLRTTILSPEYPHEASAMTIGGDVRVEVRLDEQGRVTRLRPLPGYALGVFGPCALRWVAKWTFKPATLDGVKVPGWVTMGVVFRHR